jgi:hypothetical protein
MQRRKEHHFRTLVLKRFEIARLPMLFRGSECASVDFPQVREEPNRKKVCSCQDCANYNQLSQTWQISIS